MSIPPVAVHDELFTSDLYYLAYLCRFATAVVDYCPDCLATLNVSQ